MACLRCSELEMWWLTKKKKERDVLLIFTNIFFSREEEIGQPRNISIVTEPPILKAPELRRLLPIVSLVTNYKITLTECSTCMSSPILFHKGWSHKIVTILWGIQKKELVETLQKLSVNIYIFNAFSTFLELLIRQAQLYQWTAKWTSCCF